MPAMKDKIFAVIDTNVIVSALLSSNLESNPVRVFRAIVQERVVPLYNDEILEEYRSVLSRPKFHLDLPLIETVIKAIVTDGLNIDRTLAAGIDFTDPKDIVFYEVALSVEDSCYWQYKAFPCKTIHCHPCRNGSYLGSKVISGRGSSAHLILCTFASQKQMSLPGEPQGSILGGRFQFYSPTIAHPFHRRPPCAPSSLRRLRSARLTAAIIHRTKNLYKSFLISAN